MKNRTVMIGYDDMSPLPGHTICFELYSLIVAAVKDELQSYQRLVLSLGPWT